MNASRFRAFYDAVLAIIMTVIVLQFKIPEHVTWHSLFVKIPGFFCYAGSFFWLGQMWISSYIAWQKVTQVRPRTLFWMLVSLFCSSFFPFAIELVGENPIAKPAQIFYGAVVLLTTLANLLLSNAIRKDMNDQTRYFMFAMTKRQFYTDLVIRICGLIGTILIWTPMMTVAMIISVITNIIRLFNKPVASHQDH